MVKQKAKNSESQLKLEINIPMLYSFRVMINKKKLYAPFLK